MTDSNFPGVCHLCGDEVDGTQILPHLRDVHGLEPPRWPDGKPAIAVLPHDPEPFEDEDT